MNFSEMMDRFRIIGIDMTVVSELTLPQLQALYLTLKDYFEDDPREEVLQNQ